MIIKNYYKLFLILILLLGTGLVFKKDKITKKSGRAKKTENMNEKQSKTVKKRYKKKYKLNKKTSEPIKPEDLNIKLKVR